MTYEEAWKKRNARNMWGRRIKMHRSEAEEIRAYRDELFSKMDESHKERNDVHMELTCLVADLEAAASQYEWMLRNLAGG
jgi:uncharacterized coiled-coil DUF342 family protein